MTDADNKPSERLARIEAKLEELCRDIQELRAYSAGILAELKDRTDRLQTQSTAIDKYCARREPFTNATHERVVSLENRVSEIEKLMPALRAVMWIGGALALSIVALIWALIMGQAQVVFP